MFKFYKVLESFLKITVEVLQILAINTQLVSLLKNAADKLCKLLK